MVQLILIRPGTTDYDLEARIQGTLDIPLCEVGRQHAVDAAEKVRPYLPTIVYCAPCRAAEETAEILANSLAIKAKTLDRLQNLNQGLWQGMLIDEVRRKQPKVYKQWQEHPETVRPPQGESLTEAAERVEETLEKVARKNKGGAVVLVVPEPLASLVRQRIEGAEIGDLWRATNGCQQIQVFHLEPGPAVGGPLGNAQVATQAAGNRLDTAATLGTMIG